MRSRAPMVGTLLGWMALGETMTVTKWAAVGLIVIGVVMLTADV